MDLEGARSRIRERSELKAFIAVSHEHGSGDVVAVKDLVDGAGMGTTAGGVILPDAAAEDDAPVIARLRKVGCVVVGKANLHEFAYGVTSLNPHYGNVLNPHDPSRVAGGSSGGSAVAVATGMCDWAIGSDTGGSIRIPGSLCGVAGFKPAFGSIDIRSVIPLSRSLDTLGPMAPTIAETARAYTLMSGESISLDGLTRPRLAVPAGWISGLDEPTARAWAAVSEGVPEIGFIDRGLEIARAAYEEAMGERERLEVAAHHAMDAIDAMILPATAIVAPPVDTADEVREPLSRFTRPFNTTHQPVAVLPAPAKGLPVGVQVVGRRNNETLRAAAWLEREWR